MITRRGFFKGASAAGIVFCSCGMLDTRLPFLRSLDSVVFIFRLPLFGLLPNLAMLTRA